LAELFNPLINPLGHDFALRWHRDDVRENPTADLEEVAAQTLALPRLVSARFGSAHGGSLMSPPRLSVSS
jgi:hypothetical protein